MTKESPNTIILNGRWMQLQKVLLATYPIVLINVIGLFVWTVTSINNLKAEVAVLQSKMPDNLKERLTIVETSAGDPRKWTDLVESIHNSEDAWKRIEKRLDKENP